MRSRLSTVVVGAMALLVATGCPPPTTAGSNPVPVGTLSRITSYASSTDSARISGDGQWVLYRQRNPDDPRWPLHLWNRATLQDLTIAGESTDHRPVGVSTDGRYSTFTKDDTTGGWSVNSYDRTTGVTTVVGMTDMGDYVQSSASGEVLYAETVGANRTVHRWSPSTGADETLITGSGLVLPAAISPDGNSAAYILLGSDLATNGDGIYAGPVGGPLSLVVAGSFDTEHPFAMAYLYKGIVITNDGDVVYTRFTEGAQPWMIATGTIRLWTKSTASTTDLISRPGRVVATTGISADGRYLSYLNDPAPVDTGMFDGSQGVYPNGGRMERLDRQSSKTTLMAYGRVGTGDLAAGGLSDDGKTAVIASNDPPADSNGDLWDLFLWEDI